LDPRANQPFAIGDYSLIFNGEIYNYVELRRDLIDRGIELHTTSDTEVLLRYYILHGEQCVQYFEGMWAFAIYDAQKSSLFLSRDRFAEKPLYYMESPEGFFFGSEVKFLKALSGKSLSVNEHHVLRYLVNGYKALYKTEETFFTDVRELPYASSMVVGTDGKKRVSSYWKPQSCVRPMTLGDAVDGVRQHLMESVRIRLRSDVPLAFCLSGGVDSAALASIAVKEFNSAITTFSLIDSDERYNERDNMLATINDLGCRHELIDIPQEEGLPRLKKLIEYHDAPVATITYYVHSLLSEAIAKKGYRVAFSGTAADELFTGYYDHFLLHLFEMRKRPDYARYLKEWEEHIRKFVRNPILQNPNLYMKNQQAREHVFDNSAEFRGFARRPFDEAFTETYFCDSLLRNRMMNEIFEEATRVILHEDDLNSMMYSIENRSPYLDSRLFAFAYSIPPEYLIRDGYGKYLLREAMKGILSDKVRLDRQKKGFNASIHSIVDLKSEENIAYLLEEKSPIFNLVSREKVKALMSAEWLPNHQSKFLFSFISAKMFMEMNS
jgi:asparagine synthase (glutamine-hydrolysing)